jgi:hypothetical protein
MIMKSIKITSLAILFAFAGLEGHSQELQVIGSAGSEAMSSGGSLAYTVGEVVVSSSTNAEGTLTQGYHQGFLTPTAIDEIPADLELSLYPNPASDYIIIESKSLQDFEEIQMFDMSGKLIWNASGNGAVDNRITVNFQNRAAGNYIIKLIDSDKSQSFSYSVIKSH